MWPFLLALNGKLHWIKNERLSASTIQSFLGDYTNEFCQQKKACSAKKLDLCLRNMRAIYNNYNEEQQMALKYTIQISRISHTYII